MSNKVVSNEWNSFNVLCNQHLQKQKLQYLVLQLQSIAKSPNLKDKDVAYHII